MIGTPHTPYLCTEFESVNDDWDLISGQPLRPCGYQHRKPKAGQMTASTNCCNVEKVLAMRTPSSDAQVYPIQASSNLFNSLHIFAGSINIGLLSIWTGDWHAS